MKLSNLTIKLNIKAIGIILFFMLFFIIYNYQLSLQERHIRSNQQIEHLANYLASAVPATLLPGSAEQQSAVGQSLEEQVLATNAALQPILNTIFIPPDTIKFGIYSTHLKRIVAIGPELDKTLLLSVEAHLLGDMFNTTTPRFNQQKQSVLWYGAKISYFVKPLQINNQIIGYVFACANLDKIKEEEWQRSQRLLIGSLIALLIAIVLFQEIFITLRQELSLFAEAIVEGRARDFESKISELNPILRHINEQTERMAKLDRLNIIGEMAASIGHEVRNPMTTVKGFLQYFGNKPALAHYKPQFDLMITELDRANSIITEFLSLAKNKAMHFQQHDLNEIIQEIAPLLEADALRHNCSLELTLQEIPPVIVDKRSIRQLIINIARNGLEAMPQGGKLQIATAIRDSQVVLTFTDEGIGIPLEVLDKLGTPFFTTKENGVGLGLAVCYRIIERHNATITVESQPNKGTTFTIVFEQARG